MVSILLAKMDTAEVVYCTDGDEDTIDMLTDNIVSTETAVIPRKLWWGLDEEELLMEREGKQFDILLAADVIYEEDQIEPLLESVCKLLSREKDSEFLLAFARRNVPIDKVWVQAKCRGLEWAVLDGNGEENIYSVKFHDVNK